MWYGKLPTQNELKEFRRQLAAERKLDPAIIELLRNAPKEAQPMDVLRTAVSALSFYDPEDKKNDHDANLQNLPADFADCHDRGGYDRVRKGKKVVEPERVLSHAANFLLLLNGTSPRIQRSGPWIWPSSCTPTTSSTLPPSPRGDGSDPG